MIYRLRHALSDSIAKLLSIALPTKILKRKEYFPLWEARGYHITPVHYDQPIPDTRELPDKLWRVPSSLPGLRIDDDAMLDLLSRFAARYKEEYQTLPAKRTASSHEFFLQNVSFRSVDAEILYCMIRDSKPHRIIEIGSGYTTYLEAQAVGANSIETPGYQCILTVIDPYPNSIIRSGFPGLSVLLETPVQHVETDIFESLQENDILFIDSSHVVRLGGDVVYEYLEILPRLRQGVLVHIHDIFLPYEYPKTWVLENRLFWSEQYLLQAFMAFNDSFETIWAASYVNALYPDKLEDAIPSYKRNETVPGSFWIERTR